NPSLLDDSDIFKALEGDVPFEEEVMSASQKTACKKRPTTRRKLLRLNTKDTPEKWFSFEAKPFTNHNINQKLLKECGTRLDSQKLKGIKHYLTHKMAL
ncbi:7835_t:CDS:2, partial [Funneliformis mosseae]